ncbi:SusC/RagA family TonB-linked outer membrane protein [Mucilaginibacter sp. Mucisp84]|uniref:SusC/RagA family TonB-linked outer membrane protein n=1 Tax=Mucilaginibacter sp. Mucisp84 TaxID=3243058 RepID=UPI0039A72C0C
MKLTVIFILAAFLQVSAATYAQKVTYKNTKATPEQIFTEIRKQTGYNILISSESISKISPQRVDFKGASLDEVLSKVLDHYPLTYLIEEKTILIKAKELSFPERLKSALSIPLTVTGNVVDETNKPMAGVTVKLKGTATGAVSDAKGSFSISVPDENAILTFSYIGYETQEATAKDLLGGLLITLKATSTNLNEVVINKGYYSEKRALSTGSVGVVTAKEIESQPVRDPLLTLEGRIPGLLVTQINGVSGSLVNVQIRGKNSLSQGSNPLYIIDGVPYAPGNNDFHQVNSAAGVGLGSNSPGGLSPFNSINPADIESIEILQDADATSIYGSRGANGVILITTKKGKAGKLKFDATVNSGASRITHFMPMMNTQQYLQMRNEAFKNDGQTPTKRNAYDILRFDSTSYTNLEKLFIGGTAHNTNAQVSLSGGSANTTFLVGGGYNRQTTVFPGDFADARGSLHASFTQSSADKKFNLTLSAMYSSDVNKLPISDLTSNIYLPPTLPPLHNASGGLNFSINGLNFINPLAYTEEPYTAKSDNLLSNLIMSYRFTPNLIFRTSLGYNTFQANETALTPISAQNPTQDPTGSSSFSNSNFHSWIVEPQLEYNISIGKGALKLLAGGTWQDQTYNFFAISGYGYTDDALIQSIASAATTSSANGNSDYRYQAIYGRLNYNWEDKYILNLTGRRDGSSRFGPGRQFGNFGSVGAAWLLSNEDFFKKMFPFISFGKLRGSYGTTGNDQIGDYKYLPSWTNSQLPYNGAPGLIPTGLYNSNYGWEINKKLEAALELGFLKDRVLVSAAWFRNRSSNQLIFYALPAQTGYASVIQNSPAKIQNKGLEFTLTTRNIVSEDFNWTTSFNLSSQRNKLLAFPNLATSSYASTYVVGQSLSVLQRYHSLGVDPQTGAFIFQTASGTSSSPDLNTDLKVVGNLDPRYGGGLGNNISYKSWQLDFFLTFTKQQGLNYKSLINLYVPGTAHNLPTEFLQRWQKAGDNAPIQQFTQSGANPAYAAASNYFVYSDGIYSDASYMRLKNVMLSYSFPKNWLKKAGIANIRIYAMGQNLFTITKYKGNDPETMNFYSLPPLKTITAGMQFTF